jgi:hypothetical protein
MLNSYRRNPRAIDYIILKVEAAISSETSAYIHQSTHHIPEELNLLSGKGCGE